MWFIFYFISLFMTDFQMFIEVNRLKKKDIASFLGVSNAFVTQLCDGSKPLPGAKMALIKANIEGWDTSMLKEHSESQASSNVNSVVNSHNFRYDCGISATEFLAFAQENQRQMGQLIDTIAALTKNK